MRYVKWGRRVRSLPKGIKKPPPVASHGGGSSHIVGGGVLAFL